ncbi:MAG: hypothetical protein WCI92_06945 [Bacteroidota bacterium]
MKKLFQLFKIQRSVRVKKSVSKGTSGEKSGIKTENKAYLSLPMTFDFTAYFEDKELENNTEAIHYKNPTTNTINEINCVEDEKCDEILYKSYSRFDLRESTNF